MKTPQFLYSLARLAGVSIRLLSRVCDRVVPSTHLETTPPVETTPAVRSEKKTCLCCKKTMDRLRKRIQQAGERKRKAQKGSTGRLTQEEPPQTYHRSCLHSGIRSSVNSSRSRSSGDQRSVISSSSTSSGMSQPSFSRKQSKRVSKFWML